jgi:hypothetical protein
MRLERLHPEVEGVGGVDRVVGLWRAERPDLAYAAPRLDAVPDLIGEHPPVAGITDCVDNGPADSDVVGLVEGVAAPGVAEVPRDHDLGPVPAYLSRQQTAQVQAVLQHAVRLVQEVHGVDADDARRLHLLGLAYDATLIRCQAVDAGLPAGDH